MAVGAYSGTIAASPYERRAPERTVLYEMLQEHWLSFVADLEASAESPALPAFVVAEIEAFLHCGILAHGFVLARCGDCGWARPVAFSCKRRGFCPSCIGRRMAAFAAHLVDGVMPSVALRQWVLTVPHALRARMTFDPELTSVVLRQLVAAVSSWLRRRARRLGIPGALKTGAVAVIQRFNSAAAASPHLHTLFLDGVFAFRPGVAPVFHPTPAPRDEAVARVAASVFRRVERALAAREPAAPSDGSRTNPPFPGRAFEAVSIVDVLHHCAEPRGAERSAARRRPGAGDQGPLRVRAAHARMLYWMDVAGNDKDGIPSPGTYFEAAQWVEMISDASGRIATLDWPLKTHDLPWRIVGWARLQFTAKVVRA